MLRVWLAVVVLAFALAVGAANTSARGTSERTSCDAPKATFNSWLAAWKAKNFKQMVALSQQSWRLQTSRAVRLLSDQYGFKNVSSYSFVRCSGNAVSARVTFVVNYRTFKRSRVKITAMVIREDRQGDPSPVGRWGVNPISTLREDPA